MEIGNSIVPTIAIVGNFVTDSGFLASHSFIQTAPQRIWRIASNGIVHSYATEIYILGFTGISSVLETYVAESEADDLIIRIICSKKDGRSIIITGIIHIEFREARIIHLGHLLLGNERHKDQILYIAFDSYVHIRGNVVDSLDLHVIYSINEPLKKELSVFTRKTGTPDLAIL